MASDSLLVNQLSKVVVNIRNLLQLDQVDNTSDLNKPVSNAFSIQLNLKEAFPLNLRTVNGHPFNMFIYIEDTPFQTTPISITKTSIGLGNVSNTSDALLPLSNSFSNALSQKTDTSITINALALNASIVVLKNNISTLTNVSNTSDSLKPISPLLQTSLNTLANTSTTIAGLSLTSDLVITFPWIYGVFSCSQNVPASQTFFVTTFTKQFGNASASVFSGGFFNFSAGQVFRVRTFFQLRSQVLNENVVGKFMAYRTGDLDEGRISGWLYNTANEFPATVSSYGAIGMKYSEGMSNFQFGYYVTCDKACVLNCWIIFLKIN